VANRVNVEPGVGDVARQGELRVDAVAGADGPIEAKQAGPAQQRLGADPAMCLFEMRPDGEVAGADRSDVDMSALAGHRNPGLASPDQRADAKAGARANDCPRAGFP